MKKETIYQKLSEVYTELHNMGYEPFVVILQGSQNYNLDIYTDTYESDIDCKAFVLPSFDDIYESKTVSKTYQFTHKVEGVEQVEVKDLRLLSQLLEKGNPSYLELLATDYYVTRDKELWSLLRSKLDGIIDTRYPLLLKACYGMAREKEKALCHPYPSLIDKIEKFGYDPKQIHHIERLRILMERLTYEPYNKAIWFDTEREDYWYLQDLKLGKYELREIQEFIMPEAFEKMAEILDQYVGNCKITSEVIYEVKDIIQKIVKSSIATSFRTQTLDGQEIKSYKGNISSFGKDVRAFVKEVHPEIDDTYIVEVLEYRFYEMFNHWKR